ncbi:hypothetical protein Q1W73_16575 [Asticcacaulis sp. ZE23SCel15]|uniref:hypothetical protein n=1 Tax=Asticcacaulis sp. ZE23SCel15 TaxID=3059027 RepID=UPI002660289B|nr:hypothetical protein [Asticcacaulis sp. ZE23SCel15]WKL57259.1 hypothetical protein Q1W73_16575 [Asticcacaulis sp. ZE23SCel15]
MSGDDHGADLAGIAEKLGRLRGQQERLVVEDQMRTVQRAFVTIYELGGMMAVHEAYGRAVAEVMLKFPKAAQSMTGGVGV